MSPEPTQEPIEENLVTPNLSMDARITNDSDSEDEDVATAGYMPLSQVPVESDPMLDEDEDDEWIFTSGETNQTLSVSSIDPQQAYSTETLDVWLSPCNRSTIDLDADKIDQVKSMMATFTLPTTAIPEWANTISEELWKEQLVGRIKEIQNKQK